MSRWALKMRRRDLLALIGGAVIAQPLVAGAQQTGSRVIGFLQSWRTPSGPFPSIALREGLKEYGFIEGENVVFDPRWTENYDELPKLAAELVKRPVAVIVAAGNPSAAAAKSATEAIPIVFWAGADPVAQGLVASFAHPGGNVTGLSDLSSSLGAKRLELVRELIPKAAVVGLLINPANPNRQPQLNDVEDAARAVGVQIEVANASTETEIDKALEALAQRRIDALIVAADTFIFSRREQVVALAARHKIPTMYTVPLYVQSGGLISYTSKGDEQDTARQMGRYTGRILNGEKPAELPVIISTRFQMAINLKTAQELGLAVPQSLLQRADEVIE